MLGLLLLLVTFALGGWLTARFLEFLKKTPFFWPVSWFVGLWLSGTAIFFMSWLFSNTGDPLDRAIVVFLVMVALFFLWRWPKLPRPGIGLLALWLMFFVFSWWFFGRTFSYRDGQILVASNEYLDFGAHVPLIRSFSAGQNFPPQLPFYAGVPIFYHFLFDFTAAIFEKTGWSIATSYNLLSAVSLSSLLVIIFYFAQKLFASKSRLLGLLAVVLFVCTPDLSFLFFPCQQGMASWLRAIRNHNFYLNNGLKTNPFFGGFFNINVFTNQRHLVFGIGIFLIFVLLLEQLRRKDLLPAGVIFAGILLGSLPFWHNFVMLAVILVYGTAFLIWPRRTQIFKILVIAGLIALPQIIFIQRYTQNQIIFRPGFLMHDNLTLFNWLKFWVYNLGFGLLGIIGGWLVAPKQARKFLLPTLSLFVIPNIFSFSRESFNDHKFFVLFAIFEAISIAWFLVWFMSRRQQRRWLAVGLFFLLTISGGLNLLVVKNDVWVKFVDTPGDGFLQWIEKNTQPDAVFLTNLDIWDPVNFTGRKTFLGRPHYVWAYGGQPSDRIRAKQTVLAGQDQAAIREILSSFEIDYLAFKTNGQEYNADFFSRNLDQVYADENWVVYWAVLK